MNELIIIDSKKYINNFMLIFKDLKKKFYKLLL